jgi:hypothetical protein
MSGVQLAKLSVAYLPRPELFLIFKGLPFPETQLFVYVAPGTDGLRYGAVDIEYYQLVSHVYAKSPF